VLIQETLAAGLSVSRKVRWHARIGEALEELYGVDVEAHAAELAYHFAEAVTVTGPEKMVRYSLLAGEQALATYAYEEAEAHFQRGLAAEKGDLWTPRQQICCLAWVASRQS
jgi:predicted ATPase